MDINDRFVFGRTAVFLASENGHLDILQYLIEKGADVDVMDIWDTTPLWIASVLGRTQVVEYLLSLGIYGLS